MDDEKLIALVDLPALLPKRRGRHVSLASIYRWARKGVRGRKLSTIAIGGILYVSANSIRRFLIENGDSPLPEQKNELVIAALRAKKLTP